MRSTAAVPVFLAIFLVLVSLIVALIPQPALAGTWAKTQLTTNSAGDYGPSISDDGKKIAFFSIADADEEIFLLEQLANQPPVADAGPNQEAIDVDENGVENVTLDGSGSYDTDGTIVFYEWKQGDTILSTAASFTHSFPIGTHVITLTVTDNEGATDSDWLFVTVKREGGIEGGCFIATTAYGTPMAEEIDILRDFRDHYLVTNLVGEALVDLYYNTSPPIADFIAEYPALKQVVRAGLEPVIAISILTANTNLVQKLAIISSMVLLSALLVVWFRKRVGGRSAS